MKPSNPSSDKPTDPPSDTPSPETEKAPSFEPWSWDFSPPPETELGDRQVPSTGSHLAGRRIALMISGGIAAMKTPLLARALRREGADVTAFASTDALRYVASDALEWSTTHPVVTRLSPNAEHLSDGAPFDAYLLPQATYNTINKMAQGIADGVITSTLASALGRMERGRSAVLLAPTMHGTMHNSILTDSLLRLDRMGVRIVPPRPGYGKHNIPNDEVLVAEVCRAVSRSPLRGRRILVTGGPTPVPLDGVRRITPRFRGKLGIEIARELLLRGAAPLLVHGDGAHPAPEYLPHEIAYTYDDYRRLVHERLAAGPWLAGIFSAAVADYRPTEVAPGKIPSGRTLRLELVPTPKVVEEVRERHPDLTMVTFKYLETVSHQQLIEVAERRLERYQVVIANRGEETERGGPQIAWLLTRGGDEPRRLVGKPEIAQAIADHLEVSAQEGSGIDRRARTLAGKEEGDSAT